MGDGKLNFTEFWESAKGADKNAENRTASQNEHDIFKKLDTDGDGLLDAQELVAWESGKFHTEETLRELLELADINHDHHLTVEEIEEAKEKIENIDAGLDFFSMDTAFRVVTRHRHSAPSMVRENTHLISEMCVN